MVTQITKAPQQCALPQNHDKANTDDGESRVQEALVFYLIYRISFFITTLLSLKKNQNAPRPSEHPPVRGRKMSKRLGWIKEFVYP